MIAILKHSQEKKKPNKLLNFFQSTVRLSELKCKCIHPQSWCVNISRQRKNCLFSKRLLSPLVPVKEEIIRNLGEMSGFWKLFGVVLIFWVPGEMEATGGVVPPLTIRQPRETTVPLSSMGNNSLLRSSYLFT